MPLSRIEKAAYSLSEVYRSGSSPMERNHIFCLPFTREKDKNKHYQAQFCRRDINSTRVDSLVHFCWARKPAQELSNHSHPPQQETENHFWQAHSHRDHMWMHMKGAVSKPKLLSSLLPLKDTSTSDCPFTNTAGNFHNSFPCSVPVPLQGHFSRDLTFKVSTIQDKRSRFIQSCFSAIAKYLSSY